MSPLTRRDTVEGTARDAPPRIGRDGPPHTARAAVRATGPRALAAMASGAPLRALARALACALVLGVALACAVSTAPTARAADTSDGGYRYWSFWLQKDGGDGWSYATEGPATQRPEDGDTLGFRFALSEDSRNAQKPRGTAEFAPACADTPEKEGTKRVALRLDFGTRSDAPESEADGTPPKARTECARVAEDASAADALAAVAKPLRYSSDALLCAIDGYPAKGCGEQVAASGDTGKAEERGGGKETGSGEGGSGGDGDTLSTGLGLGAGIAAVVVLGAAALWQARRRRQ